MNNEELYNFIKKIVETCASRECDGCPLEDTNETGWYRCIWRQLMFELGRTPCCISLGVVKEIIDR